MELHSQYPTPTPLPRHQNRQAPHRPNVPVIPDPYCHAQLDDFRVRQVRSSYLGTHPDAKRQ